MRFAKVCTRKSVLPHTSSKSSFGCSLTTNQRRRPEERPLCVSLAAGRTPLDGELFRSHLWPWSPSQRDCQLLLRLSWSWCCDCQLLLLWLWPCQQTGIQTTVLNQIAISDHDEKRFAFFEPLWLCQSGHYPERVHLIYSELFLMQHKHVYVISLGHVVQSTALSNSSNSPSGN